MLGEDVYERAAPRGQPDLHQQVALAARQRLVDEAALDDLRQRVGHKARDAVREMVAEEVTGAFPVGEQRADERVVGRGKAGHPQVGSGTGSVTSPRSLLRL